jgi:endonuclease YncB( thermonuclease family)
MMKRTLFKVLVGIGCGVVAACAGAEELSLQAGAIQVEDGDTVRIQLDGQERRVQLAGIDAPEDTDNPKLQRDLQRTGLESERLLDLGRTATRYLQMLTQSDDPYTLRYEPGKQDRYGRLNGELYNRIGESMSDYMVAAGFAVATADGPERLRELQADARRERRGLWQKDPEGAALWSGAAVK